MLVFCFTLLILTSQVEAKSIAPRYIEVNEAYIKSTARCSCSHYSDYNYHTSRFKNYCPNCKSHGTLIVEVGSGNHNPEGMAVCLRCDMDFCLVHGKSHDDRGYYLRRYHAKQVKAKPKPLSKKELILNKWKSFDFWKMN